MFVSRNLRYGALGVLLAVGAVAHAADLEIAGSTTGKFSATGTNTYKDLTYTGSTFDTFSTGNAYALGNLAGSPNFNNLGSLTLTAPGGTQSYSGTFELTVDFTMPTGIIGSSSQTYDAVLSGSVKVTQGKAFSSVVVDFNGSPVQTFNYNDGVSHGYFTLGVNTTAINFPTGSSSAVVPITGQGVVTGTPSPAAAIPFVVGFISRRRRK